MFTSFELQETCFNFYVKVYSFLRPVESIRLLSLHRSVFAAVVQLSGRLQRSLPNTILLTFKYMPFDFESFP